MRLNDDDGWLATVQLAPMSAPSSPRFEKLEAWQASHQLALCVYQATKMMPSNERFGLTSQMRRAAVSIASNIVEGSMRPGKQEFRRFLGIALASFNELRYQIRLCEELGYLPPEGVAELTTAVDHAGRVVWGLFRSLGGARPPN
jgi:four helix bundle protein